MSSVATSECISSPEAQNKESSSKPRKKYPTISVIGISRLTDPNYNTKLKIFWTAMLIIVTIACLHQVANCIRTYFKFSVIKDLTHVQTSTVTFPVIYLCPGFMRSILYASISALKEEGQPSLYIHKDLLQFVIEQISNSSLDLFWREQLAISSNSINLYVECSDLGAELCTEYGQLISVNTTKIASFWGTCLAISTNFTVPYRGPFTYLKIIHNSQKQNMSNEFASKIQTVKNSVSGMQNFALLFTVRSDFSLNVNYDLFYKTQVVLEGFVTHYEMRMRKFQFLNVVSEPCFETKHFTNCLNDCLSRHLSQLSTKCRMPFITNSSLESCKASDANASYLESYRFFLNFDYSTCSCYHDCHATTYSMTSNVVDKARNNHTTQMQLFFTDDTYESTTARRAYDFFIMIGDIGGTLGFFLGFCCLSIAEIVEFLIVWLSHRMRSGGKKE